MVGRAAQGEQLSYTRTCASHNAHLAESIRAWPDQQGLAHMIEDAGWRDLQWRNLSGGIVALHRGTA